MFGSEHNKNKHLKPCAISVDPIGALPLVPHTVLRPRMCLSVVMPIPPKIGWL